jgi:O-antigen ligase
MAADRLATCVAIAVAGAGLGLITVRVALLPTQTAILALLVLLAPFVAMVVGARTLLLAAVVIDIPLQWDVNLDYRPDEAKLGALGGLSVSITTFALAGLYLLWIADLLSRRKGTANPWLRPALPLIVYVGLSALSLLVARDVPLGAYELVVLVQSLLLFIYIASTVRTARDVRFVLWVLIVGLLLESILALGLRATLATFDHGGLSAGSVVDPTVPSGYRLQGTLGSPNTAGGYFALLLVPALALVLSSRGRWARGMATLSFVAGTVALLLTFSRGGWIGFAASMLVFLGVARRRGWISVRAPVAIAVAAAVVAIPFGAAIVGRVTNDEGTAHVRIPLMGLAEDIIRDQPLLGVGLNNYAVVLPDYAGPEFSGRFVYTVHNKYLLVWAEAGIGALCAFFWFLFATLGRGRRMWRENDLGLSLLTLALTAAVIGQMAHMAVDVFQSRAAVQSLWLVAAVLAALARMSTASPLKVATWRGRRA